MLMMSLLLQITFFFADNIPGPVTMYSFMFLPDNTTVPVNQSICDNSNICEYKAEVPKSVCSLTTYVGVAVSAANQLGQGPSSQPNMFGKEIIVTSCKYPV